MKLLRHTVGAAALVLALAAPLLAQTPAPVPADPVPAKPAPAADKDFKVSGVLKEEEYTRANKDTGEVAKLTRWVLTDEGGRLVLLPTAAQLKASSPALKVDLATLLNQPVTVVGHGTEKVGKDTATGAKVPVLYVKDITSITATPAAAK